MCMYVLCVLVSECGTHTHTHTKTHTSDGGLTTSYSAETERTPRGPSIRPEDGRCYKTPNVHMSRFSGKLLHDDFLQREKQRGHLGAKVFLPKTACATASEHKICICQELFWVSGDPLVTYGYHKIILLLKYQICICHAAAHAGPSECQFRTWPGG
jgi:hypothetical protein